MQSPGTELTFVPAGTNDASHVPHSEQTMTMHAPGGGGQSASEMHPPKQEPLPSQHACGPHGVPAGIGSSTHILPMQSQPLHSVIGWRSLSKMHCAPLAVDEGPAPPAFEEDDDALTV